MSNTWVRDQSSYNEEEYCEHHKTFGHSTARCRTLGLKLAAALAAGKLKGNIDVKDFEMEVSTNDQQLVQTGQQRRADDGQAAGKPLRDVLMIMGGSRHCSDTVSSIKAYQRRAEVSVNLPKPSNFPNDVISFAEEETAGIDKPHNDPLVVNLIVNDCNMRRILIDTGSSLDVIFRETLQRMDVDLTSLTGAPRPVTGFSGDTTMTMGTIQLPVQAGGITKIVEFSVADLPAVYNVILGTPWINSMRAVPSTYHMCLKFPTPRGIETIRGCQKESRNCFLLEHKLRNPVTDTSATSKRKKMKINREPVKDLSKLL